MRPQGRLGLQQLAAALLVWLYKSSDGDDIVGFEDAARSYFDKPVAQLSGDEFLALVAMLSGPTVLNPRTHPKENAERVAILKQAVTSRCGRQ